jgi:hypothetical protein
VAQAVSREVQGWSGSIDAKTESGKMNLKEFDGLMGNALSQYQGHLRCVYFLSDENDEIIYVGKTTDLGVRVRQHRRDKQFQTVHYVKCCLGNLNRLESLSIDVLKPKLNKMQPNCYQADATGGGYVIDEYSQ